MFRILSLAAVVGAISLPALAGTPTVLPEPATLSLLAVGAGALAIAKFRRRK